MARKMGDGEADRATDASSGSLQTLDRGLRALKLVSQEPGGISVADLATRLSVHRTIAYRLATTLEAQQLILRDRAGLLRLGAGVMLLASRFYPQLRAVARPVLRQLADRTGAAAFLSVAQDEECIAILVVEPDNEMLRVTYRVGSRHSLTRGAAGIAILAGRPVQPDDSEAVGQARRDGVAVTRGQLQPGAVGVASPVRATDGRSLGFEASVGVVALDDLDIPRAGVSVKAAATALAAPFG